MFNSYYFWAPEKVQALLQVSGMGATLSKESILFRVDNENFDKIVINIVPRGLYLTKKRAKDSFCRSFY